LRPPRGRRRLVGGSAWCSLVACGGVTSSARHSVVASRRSPSIKTFVHDIGFTLSIGVPYTSIKTFVRDLAFTFSIDGPYKPLRRAGCVFIGETLIGEQVDFCLYVIDEQADLCDPAAYIIFNVKTFVHDLGFTFPPYKPLRRAGRALIDEQADAAYVIDEQADFCHPAVFIAAYEDSLHVFIAARADSGPIACDSLRPGFRA